jgi:BNR/Asp-box repeat
MDRQFRSILIMPTLIGMLALPVGAAAQDQAATVAPLSRPGSVAKGAVQIDIRSSGRTIADDVARPRVNGLKVSPSLLNIRPVGAPTGALSLALDNELVNDPNADNIQIFPGTMPFIHSTQSETTLVKAKGNLIAAYNDSASAIVGPNPSGPGLVFLQLLFGAYSVSKDNGKTWSSAFFPPVPGSSFTFGDPVLAVAPNGTAYFSQLGADAKGNSTVQVNRSTDGGITWSPGIVVAIDPGSDKEWMAVGPDGVVYVTWTSFQKDGSAQLRLAKSTDGGNTWHSRTIFAPGTRKNPKLPQNALQFSQPTVDQVTGRLYIPFLHFSNSNQDFIQILVSDDGGAHFSFLNFNVPGAPSPILLPITTPGDLNECGVFPGSTPGPIVGDAGVAPGASSAAPKFFPNIRQTIHSGPAFGGSFTGLPRWEHATRLITQPAFFARAGRLYLAWNNSNTNTIGDSNAGSRILFIRSMDGGKTWSKPIQASPTRSGDLYHVHPSLTAEEASDTNEVSIAYYTQHTNGTVDVDMVTSYDSGVTFAPNATRRLTSTHFGLPPTNIPIPSKANPFDTTNYDRVIAQCYALGEYLAVRTVDEQTYSAWGDDRRPIHEPENKFDPLSDQTHPQEDVFFQRVTPD